MLAIANRFDYKSPEADYDLIRRNLNLQVAMLGKYVKYKNEGVLK